MPVSIYDIAQAAGVSAATVSNVLNDRGRFSEKTRVLVTNTAKQLGYMPNLAARGLREQRTNTIGIVTPDVSNDFFSAIVLTLERAMHEHGYTSFICNTWYRNAENADYLAELKQRGVDGIFFVGGESLGDLALLGDTPCALIDYPLPERPRRFTLARNDASQAVFDQAELLISRGCTSPAILMTTSFDDLSKETIMLPGFKRCLTKHGIAYSDDRALVMTHEKTSQQSARDRMAQALAGDFAFDGIVCIGDRIALGCCEELAAHGIKPGIGVKVIGLDNSLYSRLGAFGISTVERNTDVMARFAIDTMLSMLAGKEPSVQELIVPHRIIERASTLGPEGSQN